MGLDILLQTEIETAFSLEDFDKFSLSREFCNLMCRKDVVEHESELDQIGKITNVDISCFYLMETYPDEDYIEDCLEFAETEAEKEQILAEAKIAKKAIEGNIDLVLQTLHQLLEKLAKIDNLPNLLLPTEFDTLNSKYYFSDFTINKGKGYIDNNFGHDLRNFQRFVANAKSKGNQTVWFTYG
ncbi:hypothetical protein U8527_05350 [Kordia algicida OT-1]|uniref:DUF1877 family protein n=1 Tax=Kordia algicida OT-1 TaxID=391587 RepID=A9DMN4_9FLAO|nr:hypothetical protein [Kordia algicida]EDP97750.1 hypothetical protein KAOT1_21347 [Kordia algicida OT-1]